MPEGNSKKSTQNVTAVLCMDRPANYTVHKVSAMLLGYTDYHSVNNVYVHVLKRNKQINAYHFICNVIEALYLYNVNVLLS